MFIIVRKWNVFLKNYPFVSDYLYYTPVVNTTHLTVPTVVVGSIFQTSKRTHGFCGMCSRNLTFYLTWIRIFGSNLINRFTVNRLEKIRLKIINCTFLLFKRLNGQVIYKKTVQNKMF